MKVKQTVSSRLKLHSGPAKILLWIKYSKGRLEIPKKGRRDFWRDLLRLKEFGLVKIEMQKGMVKAELTEEGELEYLKLKIYQTGPLAKGWVCLVVFDIPEKKRTQREVLREFLEEFGFIGIQKSVWFSPFDVSEPLIEFLKTKKINHWIRVFTAKESL